MQLKSRTLAMVLALTPLVIAGPPCVANDLSRAEESKTPIIRVVVDHENHLALIPKGTVLPAGFQITASMGTSDEAFEDAARTPESERPLVFAYAPAERFIGLEPRLDAGSETGETFELKDTEGPELKTLRVENPCPVVIVVEVGPGIIHQFACTYEQFAPNAWAEFFRGQLFYPDDTVKVNYTKTMDFPPPSRDYSYTINCPVPGGFCSSGQWAFHLPTVGGSTAIEKARVRLPGGCTQDPPYCPDFSSTIELPVLNP